jgi:hypothetical protein
VAGVTNEQRVGQVVKVLGEMKRLHDELAVVVRQKLAAMRAADTDGMRSAVAREEFLARRIREQDGLRKQVLQLLGEQMGMSAAQARAMTLSELAGRVNEPSRSQLLLLAATLRETVRETAECNRIVAVVSREMLKHFRQIYEVMAQASGTPGVYSWTGRAEVRPGTAVFEAVG